MSQQENRPEERGGQIQDPGQEPDNRPETQPSAGDGDNVDDDKNLVDEVGA